MDLLDALLFNQVIIFTKTIGRTSDIARFLASESFPAIAIHGGLNQEERIAR
jgi:ATP-dependent RNA helicase UAP56/SUB2